MFDVTRRIIVCLFVAAGAAGCGSGSSAGTLPLPVSLSPSVPLPASPAPNSPTPSSPTATSSAPTSPPATSTRTAPPPSRALPLTLIRTGGLRGASDQITVEADGTAVVTRDGAQPVRTKLSADDLAALRRLVSDPALAREASAAHGNTVCSDGYRYQLRTPAVRVVTDDCGARGRPTLTKILNVVRPLLNQ